MRTLVALLCASVALSGCGGAYDAPARAGAPSVTLSISSPDAMTSIVEVPR